jgi:Ca-activated chloride channel family protein
MGWHPFRYALLKSIAEETGGQFFYAQHPQDIKRIYDTIDTLEKTEYETTLFNRYYDIVWPFIMAIIILLLIELVLSFIWFRL